MILYTNPFSQSFQNNNFMIRNCEIKLLHNKQYKIKKINHRQNEKLCYVENSI